MNNEFEGKSNYDLRYIIRYTDKKDVAGEQLLKQSPSNEDLRYIIRYTDKKDVAWEQLRKNLNVTAIVNEEALIKDIAKNVLDRPGSLDMSQWHCGTSHCLAGWACVLSPEAAEVEHRYDTETAGDVFLPNYSHLFFEDNDTVLEVLRSKVAK
ncbi:MAG: hypothetical protein KF862_07385 [Chitinophagaceae bacterium]|nr:hypothetical protein [Chitinophagaceae bacterium]